MGLFDSIGNGVGDAVNGLTGGISNTNHYNVADPYGQAAIQQQLNDQGFAVQGNEALAQLLQQQAAGQGPSVSAQILQNAQAQNANAMNSAIAGNRGVNAGMALRQGMNATANANQAAAGTAAAGRIQEQMNAQNGLQNVYGTIGNQAIQSQAVMNGANDKANEINYGVAHQNAGQQFSSNGGLLNGLGGLMGKMSAPAAPAAPDMASGMASAPAMSGADAGSMAMLAAAHGGVVPGHASVPGDSYANDKIPTLLSPGEIVVDREHSGSPEMAKEFIDHLMSQRGPSKKSNSYQGVLEAHRKLGEALAALDKKGSKK